MVPSQKLTSAVGAAFLLLLFSMKPAFAAHEESNDKAAAPTKEDAAKGTPDGERVASGQTSATKPKSSYQAEDWTVALYPVLAWAPILGATISVPSGAPTDPGYGIRQGTVSSGMNGAAFFGFGVQKGRFVSDFSVLWASLGASSDSPAMSLDAGFVFLDATAGVKLTRDLSLSAGVRRMATKFDVTVPGSPTVTWKPGIVDPMIGMGFRKSLGKKWGVDLAFKGGGFGVGSDVDLSATGRLDWRFARHFGMSMGYGALHFKITSQVVTSEGTFQRETNQTLHGPIFGLAIYFGGSSK